MRGREALCRVVVDSKYGSAWGEWCSNEVHGLYGVGIWKNIRRGWGELSSHIGFEMGVTPKFNFGMIFVARIKPSRQLFWTCLALPVLRML